MSSLFSLEHKVALVTGGSGLIGSQFCAALVEAGAKVIVADIDFTACEEVAERLGPSAAALRLDVCDMASLLEAREWIETTYGQLDVLVNNAAINDTVEDNEAQTDLAMFENFPLNLWNRVMQVNVSGVFLCSQVLGQFMLGRGGSIVNVASTYGLVAPDQHIYHDGTVQRFIKSPAYPTSKAAVVGFTKFLAAYWAHQNIRVNTLSPGGVENGQDSYFIENYSQRVPLGRMATPMDYSGAIVFLASDASSYMTGSNLVVDGGWTCI